jgi:hypothetical protein
MAGNYTRWKNSCEKEFFKFCVVIVSCLTYRYAMTYDNYFIAPVVISGVVVIAFLVAVATDQAIGPPTMVS